MTIDIRDWKAIDAAWLTGALAAGGVAAAVSGFTARKVGTGQIGDCVRFNLTYAHDAPDAPRTLVGKFPAEGAESRATGIALGNYHREIRFYQVLQSRARIATPRCWLAEIDEASHDFVLIMSDLAPAEQGDQLAGVSLDQARLVLDEAAKLHAAFWNDDALDSYAWVNGTRDAPNPVQPELVAGLWAAFKARYGDRVTIAAQRIGDAMSSQLHKYDALRQGPRCLVHCDFRPDNMLFATDAGGAPATVVDWQSFGYGPAASDIGYFIAGALDPAVRRAHEQDLLAGYIAALEREGAGAYSADVVKRHYVAGAFQHFLTAFFAAMVVTQTPRGDDMFFKMLNGAVDLIADHNALDWFD
ncbi:MAG: phosphotransferase [Alphaproteobacteria bacterium]|nr:phosphotransferase [Alphaproteobacteria bacterium]